MGDRWKMKAHDGTDPDQPISFWEGWPLTLVVLVLTGWHYSWLLEWAWRWFQ